MKFPRLLLLLLLCCYGLPSIAQDRELSVMAPYVLAGKWTGKLTQKSGGIAVEYEYEIDLTLKGNTLGGKAVIKTSSMYAYFDIKGTLSGNQVKLEDVRITNENIRDKAAWCIKKMPLKLVFKNGAYWLEGAWSGSSSLGECQPGQVFLTKQAIRA